MRVSVVGEHNAAASTAKEAKSTKTGKMKQLKGRAALNLMLELVMEFQA